MAFRSSSSRLWNSADNHAEPTDRADQEDFHIPRDYRSDKSRPRFDRRDWCLMKYDGECRLTSFLEVDETFLSMSMSGHTCGSRRKFVHTMTLWKLSHCRKEETFTWSSHRKLQTLANDWVHRALVLLRDLHYGEIQRHLLADPSSWMQSMAWGWHWTLECFRWSYHKDEPMSKKYRRKTGNNNETLQSVSQLTNRINLLKMKFVKSIEQGKQLCPVLMTVSVSGHHHRLTAVRAFGRRWRRRRTDRRGDGVDHEMKKRWNERRMRNVKKNSKEKWKDRWIFSQTEQWPIRCTLKRDLLEGIDARWWRSQTSNLLQIDGQKISIDEISLFNHK